MKNKEVRSERMCNWFKKIREFPKAAVTHPIVPSLNPFISRAYPLPPFITS